MPDQTVGNLRVGVIPDFSQFAQLLKEGLGAAMREAMANMGSANSRMASGTSSAASHIANSGGGWGGRFGGGGGGGGNGGGAGAGFGGGNSFNNFNNFNNSFQQFNASLTRMVQNLSQVTNQFSQVATSFSNVANNFNSSNVNNTSNSANNTNNVNNTSTINNIRNSMSRNGNGLGRYLRAGFLAYEGLRVLDASREYGLDSASAGQNPEKRLAAENQLTNTVGGIPIFGGAAGLLIDPSGQERRQNDLTSSIGSSQEVIAGMRYDSRRETLSYQRQAENAGKVGMDRQRAEVESRYRSRLDEISSASHSPERAKAIQEAKEKELALVNVTFDGQVAHDVANGRELPQSIERNRDLEARRQSALAQVEKDESRRQKAFQKDDEARRGAAGNTKIFELYDIQEQGMNESLRNRYETNRNTEMARPQRNRAAIRKNEVEEIDRQYGLQLKYYGENGKDFADSYKKSAMSRLDMEDADFSWSVGRSRLGLQNQADLLNLAANGRGSLGERQSRARARGILQETQEQALDAFHSGAGSLVPDLYRVGALKEKAFQADFLNGLHPAEVNLNRTDVTSQSGTVDARNILSESNAALLSLEKKIPANLADLLNQIGRGGAIAG